MRSENKNRGMNELIRSRVEGGHNNYAVANFPYSTRRTADDRNAGSQIKQHFGVCRGLDQIIYIHMYI